MKRTFDLALSIAVMFITLPFWVIIFVLIKLDSTGPLFYRGPRVGKDGEIFYILKFRTMNEDAYSQGPGITKASDPRITRVGQWLRKYKLDEIPQLINVILGDMSIVGPRPEDPRYVKMYTQKQLGVLNVKPGMASPAFINFRYEEKLLSDANTDKIEEIYIEKILPQKLQMDLDYIEKQSFLYDMRIFCQAAISIFGNPELGQKNI